MSLSTCYFEKTLLVTFLSGAWHMFICVSKMVVLYLIRVATITTATLFQLFSLKFVSLNDIDGSMKFSIKTRGKIFKLISLLSSETMKTN